MSSFLYNGFTFTLPNRKNLKQKGVNCGGFSLSSKTNYFVYTPSQLAFDCGQYVVNQHQHCEHLLISNASHVSYVAGLPAFVANAQRPVTIYVNKSNEASITQLIELFNSHKRAKVVGVESGDKIQFNSKAPNDSVFVQSGPHGVNTYSIVTEKEKMKQEFLEEYKKVVRDPVKREEFINKHKSECYDVQTTVHLTYHTPVLTAEDTKNSRIMTANVLVTSCPASIQGVLCYDNCSNSTNVEFVQFAKSLEPFSGEHICLMNLPESMVIDGYCNFRAYLIPRIPKSQADKLTIVPNRDSAYQVKPEVYEGNLPEPNMVEYKIERVDESVYEQREFVGYIGNAKAKKRQEWAEKYPNGFELAYVLPEAAFLELTQNIPDTVTKLTEFNRDTEARVIITRRSAFLLYEEAYVKFLSDYPQVAEWLCETANEIYDTEPSNVESGYDYEKQCATKATHLQDMSIRRSVKRVGRSFKGDRLVQVRGYRSEAYVLNPGQVAFHRPEWICKPEEELEFVLPGTIESFWQSNKIIITKREQ